MKTNDKQPATFGEWNRRHIADLRTPAAVSAVQDATARKALLNRRFAELFAGDADATATALVAEGLCDLYDAEHSSAFEAAYQGESVGEIKRMFL